jgi:hypothetical protein
MSSRTRRGAAAIAVTLGTLPLLSASGAGAAAAPVDERCHTIDFKTAEVSPVAITAGVPGSVRNRLTVTGVKPSSNTTVRLVPLVYIQQPVYWGIEVIGCQSGIGLPVLSPYKVTYDFTGSLGKCGIEVIGARTAKTIDLACARTKVVAAG